MGFTISTAIAVDKLLSAWAFLYLMKSLAKLLSMAINNSLLAIHGDGNQITNNSNEWQFNVHSMANKCLLSCPQ